MKTKIEEVILRKPLFGKEIVIVSYDLALGKKKKEEIVEIMEEAYNYAITLQGIFNFFDSNSELSKLNRERRIVASAELRDVVKMALKFSEETEGRYDISLGKSILERKNGKKDIKTKPGYKSIKLVGDKIELKEKDILIDLGSIAKGYIADKIAQFLRARGLAEFMIDARGDIIVCGEFEHVIEIQHPRNEKEAIGKLKLKNQSVATSGDYKQFYGSYSNSHIINSTDLISLSVVADNLTQADAFSTALFVVEEKDRERIVKNNKNIKAFSVNDNMETKAHNGFEDLLVK